MQRILEITRFTLILTCYFISTKTFTENLNLRYSLLFKVWFLETIRRSCWLRRCFMNKSPIGEGEPRSLFLHQQSFF